MILLTDLMQSWKMYHNDWRVGGTEQEYSLSKAEVKHDRVWSPNGWATIIMIMY